MTKYFLLCLLSFPVYLSAQIKQSVRGKVTDQVTQQPVGEAILVIIQPAEGKGARSDSMGNYKINELQPGRYTLKISCMNYKEKLIPNILIESGKETVLDIGLEEEFKQLKGARVKASTKSRAQNELAAISARTFSMEEVNRYAGGRSDPARLAANFAGVSAPDDSRNDIVIRGNSPIGVLWRIEGMMVANPNHFATVGSTGGPVAALNTNMLKNSDFITSAFPAEYGNATAGVFDIGFRKGNNQRREHTLQLGMLTGLEAMTEGPLKKGSEASYLLAYRYSFTGVAQAMGLNVGTAATPFYSDLSFKIQSGDGKYGRFTVFGLWGNSHIDFKHDKIDTTDLFADPNADSYFTSTLGITGLKHVYKLNKRMFVQTIVGANYSRSEFLQDSVLADESASRVIVNQTKRINWHLNSALQARVSNRLFIKGGIQADLMQMNLFYKVRVNRPDWEELWNYNDQTLLGQAFIHSRYQFAERWSLNLGLHSQWLQLNDALSLEPRLALKYNLSKKSAFTLGAGLHSQMQPLDVYFYKELMPDGQYNESNTQLGFTRSWHTVLAYDFQPADDWRIKTEIYYQHLFNVPVSSQPGSFSMLNSGASFQPNNETDLQNTGTGRNYGLELTIEKFLSKGYYGLLTGSLYQSKYSGSDGIERNTAFNGRYVTNLLLGKEFSVGKEKQHRLFADLKVSVAGGRYYTPVDLAASQMQNQQVLQGDDFAFTQRNEDYFRMDFKAGFTRNSRKRKLSHSFYFDIQNLTNHKNVFAQRYNPVTRSVNTAYQIGLFPNFTYKLQF